MKPSSFNECFELLGDKVSYSSQNQLQRIKINSMASNINIFRQWHFKTSHFREVPNLLRHGLKTTQIN